MNKQHALEAEATIKAGTVLRPGKSRARLDPVYYRLVALWILCEAMVGGLIHGLRLPVSGLVVGGCAVLCISLIAWFHPAKGSILKATIIVAIFKFILSPQAGPAAYIAVFFQGLMGEILFRGRKHFTISTLLLALLALMESGLQRILVLTIVYGNDLWIAVNDLLNRLTGRSIFTNYSSWIIGTYLGVHLLAGLIIGWFAGRLPGSLHKLYADPRFRLNDPLPADNVHVLKKRRKTVLIRGLWVLLFLLFIQSQLRLGEPVLPPGPVVEILVRSLLVIIGWVVLVGPLLKGLLQKWLAKKRSALKQEVADIERTLPEIRNIIGAAWKKHKGEKSVSRLPLFIKTVLVNVIRAEPQVLILSGPVHSGKTTYLQAWLNVNQALGILSPKIDGTRYFEEIGSGETFPMEAISEQEPSFEVGRYRFSLEAFLKAENSLIEAFDKEGWLVIDEIGPLELKDKGFSAVLRRALQIPTKKILLVVREELVDEVVKKFGIVNYEIIIPSIAGRVTPLVQKH